MKGTALLGLTIMMVIPACQQAGSDSKLKELTERIEKLEAAQKGFAEIEAFVRPILAQQKQQQEQQAASEPDPNSRFAVDVSGNDMEGPAGAAVTIVKAWDFACPYCQKVSPLLEQIVKDYGGKVRVVFKNFVVHPDAVMQAHLAGCAAGKQGKFGEFKHEFWEKAFKPYAEKRDPSLLGKDNIMKIAKELKLDTAKLQADMDSEACKKRINDDMAELNKFGVNGTPSFFVNGKFSMFSGLEAFKALIDAELKEAQASGVPADQYYAKVVMGKGEKKFKSKKEAGGGGSKGTATATTPAGH
jgi:protein-disulfide isomerase